MVNIVLNQRTLGRFPLELISRHQTPPTIGVTVNYFASTRKYIRQSLRHVVQL